MSVGALRIAIRELTKRYGQVTVQDGVNIDVASGEFLTLLGPSGSGKTTLFIPAGWLFWLSFYDETGLSLANYRRMATEPAYLSVFEVTLELSLLVTLLAVCLGYHWPT